MADKMKLHTLLGNYANVGDAFEHARGGRRDLDCHLVGLELDQRLVDRNGLAGLLEPFADGGLGDGFTESGNADLSHDVFPDLSTP